MFSYNSTLYYNKCSNISITRGYQSSFTSKPYPDFRFPKSTLVHRTVQKLYRYIDVIAYNKYFYTLIRNLTNECENGLSEVCQTHGLQDKKTFKFVTIIFTAENTQL